MKKTVTILSALVFIAGCIQTTTKTAENKSYQETVEAIAIATSKDPNIHGRDLYDLCGSGAVVVYAPRPYYELIVPELDTFYFRRFYPKPLYEESSGLDQVAPVRMWFSQFDEMTDNEIVISEPWTGMGFLVSNNDIIISTDDIVTSADLFKREKVDVEAVRKFYMEYARWYINSKRKYLAIKQYDVTKLANLKPEDIQVINKERKGDITVGFLAQRTQERSPGVVDRSHTLYTLENERLICELINCDKYIALIRLKNSAMPANAHIFNLANAKEPFVGEEVWRLDYDREDKQLDMLGGGSTNTVVKIDSVTKLFNYTYASSITSDGAPIIDVSGSLAGMHLYGSWYESSSYGIATGEINRRVQQLCGVK